MTNKPTTTRMHHNLSDATRRRLALCLTAYPAHRNRRRRQFQENTVLGCLLLLSILTAIAAIFATKP
jgi:hypothetical protein